MNYKITVKYGLTLCLLLTFSVTYGQKRVKSMGSRPGTEVSKPVRVLTIHPNPANASVEIKLPGQSDALLSDSFNLQVIDKQGVQVVDRPWQGEKLDVTSLAAGMYVVTLRNGKQTFTQKLVVVKE